MSNKNCCWCLFQFSQGASFTDLHLPAPKVSSLLQSDCCLRLFSFLQGANFADFHLPTGWFVNSLHWVCCMRLSFIESFPWTDMYLLWICSLFVSLFYLLFPISSRKKSCEHQSPQLFWSSNLCFIKSTKCCGAVTFINGPKERMRMTISVSSSLS